MGDVEDCAFVDSDTGKCVPDSSLSSSCQYQQKPDVPRLPEVVVELEDFEDPEECFPNSPHDLPVCPDCSQCFPTCTIQIEETQGYSHRYVDTLVFRF
ncbi:zinc finger protein 770-like [Labeo rohita]|uniref:Zinc finger protein 770-like n=1 Tax=Labeo rohita TaxID=84645 RepID=A0A498N4N6_LABRO|nr:zinc finger protein 770-like [Labeo rohita]